MTDVICTYCNHAASPIVLDELDQLNIKTYYCHNCAAEYLYLNNKSLAAISLFTKINDKVFRYTKSSSGKCQLWLVDKNNIHSRYKNLCKLILNLNDFTEITPNTINGKVRYWLLFI